MEWTRYFLCIKYIQSGGTAANFTLRYHIKWGTLANLATSLKRQKHLLQKPNRHTKNVQTKKGYKIWLKIAIFASKTEIYIAHDRKDIFNII